MLKMYVYDVLFSNFVSNKKKSMLGHKIFPKEYFFDQNVAKGKGKRRSSEDARLFVYRYLKLKSPDRHKEEAGQFPPVTLTYCIIEVN